MLERVEALAAREPVRLATPSVNPRKPVDTPEVRGIIPACAAPSSPARRDPPFEARLPVGRNHEPLRCRTMPQRNGKEKAMATKVAKTGIKREKGWLYYLDKKGNVSRARMARGGGKPARGKPQEVAKAGVKREDGFLYFIDKQGDVRARKMARRGGREPPRAGAPPRAARAKARRRASREARRARRRGRARRSPAKRARRSPALRQQSRGGGAFARPPGARYVRAPRPAPAPRALETRRNQPCERPPDPGRPPRAARAAPTAILVVDDEEAILESLELTLGDDYRVFTAHARRRRASRSSSARTIALVIVGPGDAGHERRRVPREGRSSAARSAIRMMLTGYADIDVARARGQRRPHLPLHPEAVGARRAAPQREARARGATRSPPRTRSSPPRSPRPTSGCAPRTSTCAARWSAATRSTRSSARARR